MGRLFCCSCSYRDFKNTHVRKAKWRRTLPEIVCRLQAHRHSLRPVSQTIGNITAHRSIRFWNILVIPEHNHSNVNLSTYLKASLGRSCQLLDPVLTEPPRLSQLLLQLLLPTDQCWIGAARKEPVILNQFCATGKGECCLDWGWIYGWEVGYIMGRTEWWRSERRHFLKTGWQRIDKCAGW